MLCLRGLFSIAVISELLYMNRITSAFKSLHLLSLFLCLSLSLKLELIFNTVNYNDLIYSSMAATARGMVSAYILEQEIRTIFPAEVMLNAHLTLWWKILRCQTNTFLTVYTHLYSHFASITIPPSTSHQWLPVCLNLFSQFFIHIFFMYIWYDLNYIYI